MNPENCLLDLQDAGDVVKKIIIRVVTILHVKYDKKGKHVQTKSHRYGLTPHQTDRRQYTLLHIMLQHRTNRIISITWSLLRS